MSWIINDLEFEATYIEFTVYSTHTKYNRQEWFIFSRR